MTVENDHLVLISGKTGTGKSASLRNLKDPEGVMYLNCENNKKLPFKSKFKEFTIVDPLHVPAGFTEAEKMQDVHTVITDTMTFLMDMYETKYVLTAPDSRKAWGSYSQYFKSLMSNQVAKSTKNCIFLAHTLDVMNDKDMQMDTLVKVKGALMNQGVEAYFSTVISTKKVPLRVLEPYQSAFLNISDEDKELGFKYVYQTRLTKETVNERIRSPIGMWNKKETYIDNDIQHVIKRLHEYYD